MDIAVVGGILFGIISIVIGYLLEGGEIGSLFQVTAAMIVFGGTIGATAVGYSVSELKNLPKILQVALFGKEPDLIGTIDTIVKLAVKARKEGLIALESDLEKVDNQFLKKGLQLVVDAADPTMVKNSMELSIYATEQRHKVGIGIFEAAGGYAPTMGIVGTVMGLVHVLSSLNEPESLGGAIAVAFIATLYGISSANLLWLPIAAKLKNKSHKETMVMEMMIEGVLAIQAGENPMFIQARLTNFLRAKDWEAVGGKDSAEAKE
ncbi:flagellar motor protein [Bacillota bacterium LX-D]|nr:flagellar motor protein [Bacillota bacterium LX-D]